MDSTVKFEPFGFEKRIKSMIKVDFRRAFGSRLLYIVLAVALFVPIVMNVMLTMMDGQESVNQQTGEVTVMEGPESVWESIGTLPEDSTAPDSAPSAEGDAAAMGGGMDVLSMCNINMMFMGVVAFICLFISDDFKCGYAKNLFTVRAEKWDYVISKTLVGFVAGALMLILYFVGAMLAGAITGLSFELGTLTAANIFMCMLAKIFLMLVFVSIFTLISIAVKQKTWLSVCLSLGGGMLLFMMVSMITPLNSGAVNVILCLVGGALFAIGLGAVSNAVLKKTALV